MVVLSCDIVVTAAIIDFYFDEPKCGDFFVMCLSVIGLLFISSICDQNVCAGSFPGPKPWKLDLAKLRVETPRDRLRAILSEKKAQRGPTSKTAKVSDEPRSLNDIFLGINSERLAARTPRVGRRGALPDPRDPIPDRTNYSVSNGNPTYNDFVVNGLRWNLHQRVALLGNTRYGDHIWNFPVSCDFNVMRYFVEKVKKDPSRYRDLFIRGILSREIYLDNQSVFGCVTMTADASTIARIVSAAVALVRAAVARDTFAFATTFGMMNDFFIFEGSDMSAFSDCSSWYAAFTDAFSPDQPVLMMNEREDFSPVYQFVPREVRASRPAKAVITLLTTMVGSHLFRDLKMVKVLTAAVDFGAVKTGVEESLVVSGALSEVYKGVSAVLESGNLRDFLVPPISILFVDRISSIIRDPDDTKTVTQLGEIVAEIDNLLGRVKYEIPNPELSRYKEKALDHKAKILQILAKASSRSIPFPIFLYGTSGAGKTTMINECINLLAHEDGWDRFANDVIHVNLHDKYPAGAGINRQAKVLVINDCPKDYTNFPQADKTPLDLILQQSIDSYYFYLRGAAIEDKGVCLMDLRYVIITSNFASFVMVDDCEKLVRRLEGGGLYRFSPPVPTLEERRTRAEPRFDPTKAVFHKMSVSAKEKHLIFKETAQITKSEMIRDLLRCKHEHDEGERRRIGNFGEKSQKCACGMSKAFHVVSGSPVNLTDMCDMEELRVPISPIHERGFDEEKSEEAPIYLGSFLLRYATFKNALRDLMKPDKIVFVLLMVILEEIIKRCVDGLSPRMGSAIFGVMEYFLKLKAFGAICALKAFPALIMHFVVGFFGFIPGILLHFAFNVVAIAVSESLLAGSMFYTIMDALFSPVTILGGTFFWYLILQIFMSPFVAAVKVYQQPARHVLRAQLLRFLHYYFCLWLFQLFYVFIMSAWAGFLISTEPWRIHTLPEAFLAVLGLQVQRPELPILEDEDIIPPLEEVPLCERYPTQPRDLLAEIRRGRALEHVLCGNLWAVLLNKHHYVFVCAFLWLIAFNFLAVWVVKDSALFFLFLLFFGAAMWYTNTKSTIGAISAVSDLVAEPPVSEALVGGIRLAELPLSYERAVRLNARIATAKQFVIAHKKEIAALVAAVTIGAYMYSSRKEEKPSAAMTGQIQSLFRTDVDEDSMVTKIVETRQFNPSVETQRAWAQRSSGVTIQRAFTLNVAATDLCALARASMVDATIIRHFHDNGTRATMQCKAFLVSPNYILLNKHYLYRPGAGKPPTFCSLFSIEIRGIELSFGMGDVYFPPLSEMCFIPNHFSMDTANLEKFFPLNPNVVTSAFLLLEENIPLVCYPSTVEEPETKIVYPCLEWGRAGRFGDCGSPLVSHGRDSVILGFVSHSRVTKAGPISGAVFVTQDDIKAASEFFRLPSIVKMTAIPAVDLLPLSDRSEWWNVGSPHVHVLGTLAGSNRKFVSKIRPTVLHSLAVAKCTKTFSIPKKLAGVVGGPGVEEWKSAMTNQFRYINMIDGSTFAAKRLAAQCWLDDAVSPDTKCTGGPLTLAEAFFGQPDAGVDRVVMKTSTGRYLREAGYRNKFELFINGPGEKKILDPDVARFIRARLDHTCDGILDPVAIDFTPKDEVRETSKLDAFKIRLFANVDFTYNIVMRMLVMPIVQLFLQNRFSSGIMGLMNAGSLQWGQLGDWLTFDGGAVFCMDFSTFDMCHSSQWFVVVAEVFFKASMRIGYSPRDAASVFFVVVNLCYQAVVYMCDLVFKSKGLPSGVIVTLILNSIINGILLRMAFAVLCPEIPLSQFRKYVHEAVVGDDNVVGVAASIKDRFNTTTIFPLFQQWGYMATPATKEGEAAPYGPLADASFLKRKWRTDPETGYVFAPLDEDSIWKALAYERSDSGETPEARLYACAQNAQREFFLYGREVFLNRQLVVEEMFDSVDLNPPPRLDWDLLLVEFVEGRFTTFDL